MKPTLQLTESRTRRDSCGCRVVTNGFAKIEQNFRPNSHADFAGRCHGDSAPSFRRISDDYFENEAPAHFASEAVVFGLMILTAAVPVIQGASSAVHFLRVVGLI